MEKERLTKIKGGLPDGRMVSILEEKEFAWFQDESTRHFWVNPGGEAGNVVVAMRDPLPGEIFSPIVNELVIRGHRVDIFGDDASVSKIQMNRVSGKRVDPLLDLSRTLSKAKVAVASQSEIAGPEKALLVTAQSFGVPTIGVQDTFWVTPFRDAGQARDKVDFDFMPDNFCVLSYKDKLQLLVNFPGYPAEKVIVTGSPMFDDLNIEKRFVAKEQFRMKHQIAKDETVITWMGQIREANTKSFGLFIDSFRKINTPKHRLVIRQHPKDTVLKAEYLYKAAGLSLIETDGEDVALVRKGSDVVVTMFSTEGFLHSLEGGSGTIFIKIPRWQKESEFIGKGYEPLPLELDGTIEVVKETTEMKSVLKKVLFNSDYQEGLLKKEKEWLDTLGGEGATGKIVNLIEDILQRR